MKKMFFGIMLAASFLLVMNTSCSDPIFSSIREEVELEDADVSGAIYSIVRYKDDLYTQNGKIYKKAQANILESHSWDEFSAPPVSATYPYANKLAADENYLYVQVTKINSDDMEGENVTDGSEIWCWQNEEDGWKQVQIQTGTDSETGEATYTSSFSKNTATLFCTNAVQAAHRIAYLRWDGKIYKLNGATVTESLTLGTDDNTTVPNSTSRNCAYFEGKVYFTTEAAMVTNETADSDATMLFRVEGDDTIYYRFESGEWTKWYGVGYNIYSLAATGRTGTMTDGYLVVGTSAGLWLLHFNEEGGCDGDITSSFKNTSATLSSYYRIHADLVVDPSKTLLESTIYASADYSGSSSSTSASTKNRGLWSYLGSTRTSWNRE
ncbi:MAG: hypothetical protein II921_10215 [Treponema sp.]|nr:hypothetical protein [Treponema sp.]